MSTFKQPWFRDYRNSEFLQFMKDVLQLVDNYDASLLQLTEQRNALATHAEMLATVFEQEKQQKMTELLLGLDIKRDRLFSGMKRLLEGNTHHFDTVKQEAAKRLLFHLESYGKNVTRMNYQAQTAVIDNMLSEWETETILQQAVISLQLSEWASALQDINTQFNQQYIGRVIEVSATKTPSFSSLRVDAKTVYRRLVKRVEAFQTLNLHNDHTNLYHEIHELVRRYNLVVKGRRKISRLR